MRLYIICIIKSHVGWYIIHNIEYLQHVKNKNLHSNSQNAKLNRNANGILRELGM